MPYAVCFRRLLCFPHTLVPLTVVSLVDSLCATEREREWRMRTVPRRELLGNRKAESNTFLPNSVSNTKRARGRCHHSYMLQPVNSGYEPPTERAHHTEEENCMLAGCLQAPGFKSLICSQLRQRCPGLCSSKKLLMHHRFGKCMHFHPPVEQLRSRQLRPKPKTANKKEHVNDFFRNRDCSGRCAARHPSHETRRVFSSRQLMQHPASKPRV